MTSLLSADSNLLDQAIRRLEDSERPFYEGVQLTKQAANDLRHLLIERTKYSNAMRAINRIAKEPCESADAQPTHADCEAAIAAGTITAEHRCWPCYARHVLQGGNP